MTKSTHPNPHPHSIILSRLISGLDLNGNADPESPQQMRWIGRVNWPTTIPVATARQGAIMICNHLATCGYTADFQTRTDSDDTRSAEFTVCRDSATTDPEADWLAALRADTQSDGHTNGGFNPAPADVSAPHHHQQQQQAKTGTAQKRGSLYQMNRILEEYKNGQRTECRGNGYSNGHSDERCNGGAPPAA